MIKYVNLGKTGLKVSRVTLGTMTYGSRKLIPFLDINHERHHAYAGYAGLVVLASQDGSAY
ncbi:MAG: hypothetical protein V7L05_31215 [Nostoc sp.]|uniref:hypothetical protein n=1 Tax=Nostoc sp. TaxID=1180 RepID=UPI002FFCAA50